MGNKNSKGMPQATSLEPATLESYTPQACDLNKSSDRLTDTPATLDTPVENSSVSERLQSSALFSVNWRVDPPQARSSSEDNNVYEKLETIKKAACTELDFARCRIVLIGAIKFWIITSSGSFSPSLPSDYSSPFTACYESYLDEDCDCYIVPDMSTHPRFENLDVVNQHPYAKFYSGTPILSAFDNRQCIGFACLPDFKAREPFNETEKARFKELAAQVGATLQEDILEHLRDPENPNLVPAVPAVFIDISSAKWSVIDVNEQWKQLTGITTEVFQSGGGFFNLLVTESDEGMLSLRQAVASGSSAISEGADPESIHSKVCIMTPLDVSGASLQFLMAFKPASAEEISDLVQNGYTGARHHIWKAETHLRSQIKISSTLQTAPSAQQFTFTSIGTSARSSTNSPLELNAERNPNSSADTDASAGTSDVYRQSGKRGVTLPPRLRALQIGKRIGAGSFGVVYHGTLAGVPVAVKLIEGPPSKELSEGQISEQAYKARSEYMIGTDMLHENLVKTIDWTHEHTAAMEKIMIVQELCDKGSLWQALDHGLLRKNGDPAAEVDLKAVLETALDVARGMQHLHDKSFLHGDLSANNVMFCSANNDRGYIAKVSDFGMSRIPNADVATQTSGTVSYMAVELLTDGTLTQAADVYSYGVLLWEIITSEHAWQKLNFAQIIFAVTVKGEKLKLPEDAPADYADLACRCMADEPSERPTFDEIVPILEHMLAEIAT